MTRGFITETFGADPICDSQVLRNRALCQPKSMAYAQCWRDLLVRLWRCKIGDSIRPSQMPRTPLNEMRTSNMSLTIKEEIVEKRAARVPFLSHQIAGTS